jgi:hypothetical protein
LQPNWHACSNIANGQGLTPLSCTISSFKRYGIYEKNHLSHTGNFVSLKKNIMQAYRFETRISKEGVIQLPFNRQLIDREVEIIILPKQDLKPSKNASIDFIDKWAGFLTNINIEDSKYKYLNEKYK